MSVNYAPVLWNKQKKLYDKILWLGILLILTTFIGSQLIFYPSITAETLIIRATAFTAIILLHIILIIGPLCRINSLFLPLLYNRRHLGVSMFLIAAVHGIFSIIQFHALGDVNPIVSVFTSNQHYQEISEFPFQIFGFFALIIFFLMAATSHDFWLKNLSPKIWKGLHFSVYFAYGLIVLHVATGTLQYDDSSLYSILLIGGFVTISGLHLYVGRQETKRLKAEKDNAKKNGFYEVLSIKDISEKCATTVFINDENIAIFKYDNKVSAVHNVCKHQMGPIGEGKIVNGCITCPWHGYQYLPENGQSPPPFTEKLNTYEVKIIKGKVWVNPTPKAEGTFIEPAKIK
ncbi:MAG: sulfoxide reductase heme-binding subunit YedZ [Cognaticolwellia sp.]|jgi:sulfoxide reductase heme-binding subunit YedZ